MKSLAQRVKRKRVPAAPLLVDFRERFNITQAELAQMSGVKQCVISSFETGIRPLSDKHYQLIYSAITKILTS
jgi:predicted transcriptional regulator